MANTSINEYLKNLASGKGYMRCSRGLQNSSNTSSAAAASGFINTHMAFNLIGTTIPGTLVGIPLPPALTSELILKYFSFVNGGTARTTWLCRAYRFGTLNLAATGNRFTHDGTFTRLQRTVLGQASQNISLIPIIYITTATTVTQAVLRLRTVAGGAGYDDQDGNSIVATRTMTMPAAATLVNSAYVWRLEEGDSGVLNISNIEVTTAASAGAASIFGIEPILQVSSLGGSIGGHDDGMFGGISFRDASPAVPDAGSVTSYLCFVSFGSVSSPTGGTSFTIYGALNS